MLNPQVIPTTNGVFNQQPFGSNQSTWGTQVTDGNWENCDLQLGGSQTIDLTGAGDYTLTTSQSLISFIKFTGTLTANRNVIVPNLGRQYWVWNDTTSNGFTINFMPYLGSGPTLTANSFALIRILGGQSQAVAVTFSSGVLSLPLLIGQGGTGATTAGQALTNLGGGTTGISLFGAASASAARSTLGLGAAAIENLGGPIVDDGSGNLTLSPTPSTALLNTFVGDTGTGGTKGLVPAPAAGDGAANKLLDANGTWVAPSSLPSTLRATTTTSVTVASTDKTLDISAAAGTVTVTYPLSLGTTTTNRVVRISKVDVTANQILISDGTNIVDAISAPATANGQINGWRDVYANGTKLRSMGVG